MRKKGLLPLFAAAFLHLCGLAPVARANDPQGSVPPWGESRPDEHHDPGHEATLDEEHHPELFEEVVERPRFWIRGEYLLWWTKNGHIPVLLTRGESTDPLPGALGQPNTKVLYAGDVAFHDRNGARISAGLALDAERAWSFAASYFFLNARRTGTELASSGNPVLARPFVAAASGTQNSSIVSFPGMLAGSIDISSSSYLHGLEGNVQKIIHETERVRVELLAGFRYLDLLEALTIQEASTASAGAPAFAGRMLRVLDRFAVDDDFYGGQVGFCSEMHIKRLTLGLVGKIAFGAVRETARINGQTLINTAVPTNAGAGLLALSSNSGELGRTSFAVVPELGVNVGLRLTPRLTVLAGYTFIYWSRVIRPGDQVDTVLNTNLIPTSDTFGAAGGPRRPAFAFQETDYWAQGLNFGLEFRY